MKKFLEKNKIYLEIITSITVLAASIIVGVVSIQVSKKQLEISVNEMNPYFHIEVGSEELGVTSHLESNNFKLLNIGGPIRELEVEIYELVAIDHIDDGEKYDYLLQVNRSSNNYWRRDHKNLTGVIRTYNSTKKSAALYRKFNQYFRSLDQEHEHYPFEVDRNILVEVRYTGKLGHPSIQNFYNNKLITEKRAKRILETSTEIINIEKLPLDILMEKYDNLQKNRK